MPSGNLLKLKGMEELVDTLSMFKQGLFTCLFLSLSAWGQSDELGLRLKLSRKAQDNRLKESATIASEALNQINTPLKTCTEFSIPFAAPPRERFILVGVSGFGTGEDGEGQPSGAHDNLPFDLNIAETYKLTHGGPSKKLDEVLENFKCVGGVQGAEHLGLIIMANSWGAGKATKLAKMYHDKCGRDVELFVMVDGINKPIPSSFSKAPIAHRCINYFQRTSTLKGNQIEGCENHDLSSTCHSAGVANCHIEVEWEGTGRGAEIIKRTVRGY